MDNLNVALGLWGLLLEVSSRILSFVTASNFMSAGRNAIGRRLLTATVTDD
jgi:hypothetical protein